MKWNVASCQPIASTRDVGGACTEERVPGASSCPPRLLRSVCPRIVLTLGCEKQWHEFPYILDFGSGRIASLSFHLLVALILYRPIRRSPLLWFGCCM